MSDRELLELAAQAAGLSIDKSPYNGGGSSNDGFDISGNVILDWHNNTKWNPLTEDGDAFRLAVKLKIDIYHYSLDSAPHVSAHDKHNRFGGSIELYDDSGEFAATRRAIVRAAAAIGGAKG